MAVPGKTAITSGPPARSTGATLGAETSQMHMSIELAIQAMPGQGGHRR